MLLLMGVFGIYCGFVYNDVFGQAMNLFGSKWKFGDSATEAERTAPDDVYPFGVDPQVRRGAKFVCVPTRRCPSFTVSFVCCSGTRQPTSCCSQTPSRCPLPHAHTHTQCCLVSLTALLPFLWCR